MLTSILNHGNGLKPNPAIRLPPSGEEVRRNSDAARHDALTRAAQEAENDQKLAGVARRISM